MTTEPLTTEQIRNLVAWNPVTGEYDADRYAAFDEWHYRITYAAFIDGYNSQGVDA